jgi:hypothetical protein
MSLTSDVGTPMMRTWKIKVETKKMPLKIDYRYLVMCVSRPGLVIYKRNTPTAHFLVMFTVWIYKTT